MSESPRQKIFVWDVDGVILDSAKESHIMTSKTLELHKQKIEKALGVKLPNYSFPDFSKDRPYVDKAHDYFIHAISRSLIGKAAEKLTPEQREKIYQEYKTLFDELSKEFYAVRKELQNKNMKAWNDLNPVYKGIPEAMKELNEAGYRFVVVSSKDKASIWSALKHHGLEKFFKEEDILDTSTGKNRTEQMSKMLSKYGTNAQYVVIDDLPDNHALSKIALGKVQVRYFGAKWGYGVGWDKHRFITVVKDPKELARELHLKDVLKEHITRHRGMIKVPFLGHYVLGERTTRQVADEKKQPHVIVSVLIKDKQGNYFLQKRASTKKDYPDMITTSSSGAVRHLEQLEKAAARETQEELGVKVKNLRPLWKKPIALDPNHPHRLFFPFVAETEGAFKPNPNEVNVKESRFYSQSELANLNSQKKLTPPAQNFFKLIQQAKSKELKNAA